MDRYDVDKTCFRLINIQKESFQIAIVLVIVLIFRQILHSIAKTPGNSQCLIRAQLNCDCLVWLQVRKFPVSAFKRNGMQDVEHSTQGTANFLVRHPRDVAVECCVRVNHCKVSDPAKVPPYCPKHALGCSSLKKKPITIKLEELLDDSN